MILRWIPVFSNLWKQMLFSYNIWQKCLPLFAIQKYLFNVCNKFFFMTFFLMLWKLARVSSIKHISWPDSLTKQLRSFPYWLQAFRWFCEMRDFFYSLCRKWSVRWHQPWEASHLVFFSRLLCVIDSISPYQHFGCLCFSTDGSWTHMDPFAENTCISSLGSKFCVGQRQVPQTEGPVKDNSPPSSPHDLQLSLL